MCQSFIPKICWENSGKDWSISKNAFDRIHIGHVAVISLLFCLQYPAACICQRYFCGTALYNGIIDSVIGLEIFGRDLLASLKPGKDLKYWLVILLFWCRPRIVRLLSQLYSCVNICHPVGALE